MIASRRKQKGTVLVLGLLILLVMTTLGVKAILGSNLQERLVANQKQTIEATMAAESGAALAIQWLRTHPEAWGDAGAWEKDPALPSRASATSKGDDGPVHWIERIDFRGDTAIIVSRGGVWVGDGVLAQTTVTVAWQDEGREPDSALATDERTAPGERQGENPPTHGSAGGVAAATAPLGGIVGLKIPTAGASGETAHGPATVHDAAGHADRVATPDDRPRTRKIRGRVLFWRQSAAVDGPRFGERP